MTNPQRVVKVWFGLLIAMSSGAIVLMALGSNPPSAGPFCLSSYYRLNPVEEAISSNAVQSENRWNCIEIYYSNTGAGNIQQLASLNGLSSPEDLNCHFCLSNGRGEEDGKILSTEKWYRQWSIIPGRNWYGTPQTIRICLIAEPKSSPPTDFQVKRTETLAELLAKKFNIVPADIYYPIDWAKATGF